ncbi:MAG: hypothetical protein II855_08380 [Candidatus Methanomethylophilaceae archaeon]|nr:hypothetical protein [Candidatus Methanomethylophilaceae archaeon]
MTTDLVDNYTLKQYLRTNRYVTEDLLNQISIVKERLGDTIEDSILLEGLNRYTHRYRMNLEAASRAVIRDYGGNYSDCIAMQYTTKQISDISTTDSDISIVAKVMSINRKQVNVKGESKTALEVVVYDETGEIVINIWDNEPPIEKGGIYRFSGCSPKVYNNVISLYFSRSGIIEHEENANFRSLEEKLRNRSTDISKISARMRLVTVFGVVEYINKSEYQDRRTFEIKERFNGMINDDTGRIGFVVWDDPDLKAGDVICLHNFAINVFKGVESLKKVSGSSIVRV